MSIFQLLISNYCLDILFPRFCIGCNREGIDFCNDCLQNLRPHTMIRRDGFESLEGVITLAAYGDPVIRNLIQTWKYDRVLSLTEPLAVLIRRGTENLRPLFNADFITPVPLHWYRERERGFNQAAVIAKTVSAVLGTAVSDVLTRVRKTAPQSKLRHGSSARAENVASAFELTDGTRLGGKRCLLVDD